ncbi:ubiquitin carboxyl-terminal hydrolase 16 [Cornus florida]|uniref:ubiquitin carboxyl-terminal hydrolase 16 n=1 Tax=Cornus florida TaxID=4283 RepID=UPI00289ADCCF|nr:ubiquitin carboxyl-terminal hydrolase 16 [Cornus florida]
MLVGRDLGFLCRVLVVALFAPVVIGFVVRRKWRIAAARTEEIKRLLVLASEEAARAELEASYGYISDAPAVSRQVLYQCAVCFCPTSTRCARCKAVRYCSGKCQIIHWRQGHKEECRPFATTDQINDVGCSTENTINQEEFEIHGNSFEPEGKQCAKPVEKFPEEPAISNSSSDPEVFCGKDDTRTECIADGKGNSSASKFTTSSLSEGFSMRTTSSESSADVAVHRVSSSHPPERLGGHNSSNIVPDKLETACSRNMDQIKQSSTKHPTLVNTLDSFNSSGKSNQIKADCNDGDSACRSTSSSSTPSSGFWEGTIDSSGSKDDLEDSAQSSSIKVSDAKPFQSSLRLSFNLVRDAVPPLHVQGSDTKQILSDDSRATTLGIKKPIDGAAISEEICKDNSKTTSLPSLSSEVSKHVGFDSSSDSRVLKCRERRSFPSSPSYAHSASDSGRHSISTDASNASSLRSLSTERSNHVVNGTSGAKDGRRSVSSQKSRKVDSADAPAANPIHFAPMANNGTKTSMKVVEQFRSSKSSSHHPSGVGGEIVRRYNNKGLFPYEVFVKLYTNKAELRPCGLINCGNSCYANSVLQCLAFTPPLTAYFLQGLHSKACEKKGWCFTCELENLILKAKEGSSPLSPIGILSQLQNIGSQLGNGREEDAHEFLRYAIETMQSVCLKEAGVKASGSLEEETTLIGLTFGGYLRSKIKCMKCGGKSERHEKMMDLTVEIGGDIGTLEEALRKYTGTEILDGENKYHCSRCKSYEKAKKKLTVLEAPNVLTIALKRFQSGKFGKLNKAIQFPEILNLAPYVSGSSDKSPIYRLYGVVVHLDIMNAAYSGHYVCYVKNFQNKWFKIDDSTVKAVEPESVLTKGAYMLLYARCSPRAPKLIRNSIVPRDPRKIKNPTFNLRSQPSVLPLNGQAAKEPFYLDHISLQRIRKIFEEDSSSDNSSSFSLSEEGSSSTESTRGSTGADDFLDQIVGDFGHNWNSPCRNSSDSDTSSSSSSSSPSPLYSRHSPLADLDRYDSEYAETNDLLVAKSAVDRHDLQSGQPRRISKMEDLVGYGSVPFLNSDRNKERRKLASSSSSREV